MNSRFVFRVSFYLMLVVSSLVVIGDLSASRFSVVYPLMVIVAAAAALTLVDQTDSFRLNRTVANALGLATLIYFYYEYKSDETELIRALGHWIILLELVKFFMPKTSRDDWILFLLGLTQVLIGAVVNQSEEIGGWLFLWAMLAIWVLGQFFLQREADRAARTVGVMAVKADAAQDPYHGLYDLPFAFDTTRVIAATLALGGLIFLALPRQGNAGKLRGGNVTTTHLSGFDEEVRLGVLGEILENDSVVMTIELTDGEGKTYIPDSDPLWRGTTMILYDKQRWRQAQRTQQLIYHPGEVDEAQYARAVVQKIRMEPSDTTTLFAMRPVIDWDSTDAIRPGMNPLDGSLICPDLRGQTYSYTVVSATDPNRAQTHEEPPRSFRTEELLSLSRNLRETLRAIALPVVAHITETGRAGTIARARALESYLRDSGQFSYSLKMEVLDRQLDPVVDFLKNRRQGHCEYFASALALLLRSIDIPARMVNGFKGGDWNPITQRYSVRQKHAHSWVEAYVGTEPMPGRPDADRAPLWITLDPTPAEARRESIAQVGGVTGHFHSVTDIFRHVWVYYIVGYDGDRQKRILYDPMLELLREMRTQYSRLGAGIRGIFLSLFHFRDLSSLISIRGFFATFILLSLLAAIGLAVARLLRWLFQWVRGPAADEASRSPGVLFYRRLTQLLAAYRLERAPTETQREFAARAAVFLSAHGPETHSLVDVPHHVADAFYRVWFGQRELSNDDLDALNRQLDQLEASLKKP